MHGQNLSLISQEVEEDRQEVEEDRQEVEEDHQEAEDPHQQEDPQEAAQPLWDSTFKPQLRREILNS